MLDQLTRLYEAFYGSERKDIYAFIAGYDWELDQVRDVITDPRFQELVDVSLPTDTPSNQRFKANALGTCIALSGLTFLLSNPTASLYQDAIPFRPMKNRSHDDWNDLNAHLYMATTARVRLLLEYMGRPLPDPSQIRQLSLGSGEGINEIFGLHAQPKMTVDGQTVSYNYSLDQPSEITLVDINPQVKRRHDGLSHHFSRKFPQFNPYTRMLTMDALDTLSPSYHDRSYTLVTMLRYDPHLFNDDIAGFFSKLSTVIEPGCHFLATIGAGENTGAWSHRVEKMREIEDILQNRGLAPLFVDLTDTGDRSTPIWGMVPYTHHMALHCVLDPDILHP
ncbi:hypothetical protein HY409_00120 [Candidatus Gottesmanbacteria bacterium]|nr:hypothetical protein [Candidatus Gottesmanbacteria bacterium]